MTPGNPTSRPAKPDIPALFRLLERFPFWRPDPESRRALQLALTELYASEEDEIEQRIGPVVDLTRRIEAPYFLRYVIKRDALRTPERYARWSRLLETERIKLAPGGTHEQRYAAIEPWFDGLGEAFIDVGCGKGYHLARLAPLYTRTIAFEARAQERARALAMLEPLGIDLCIEGAYRRQLLPPMADVLLTEVIEHVPLDAARALVSALASQGPRRLVITAPNRLFNEHYGAAGFRHPDHKWEPSPDEFKAFIHENAGPHAAHIQFKAIGDRVEGQPMCLLAVIES